jgi:hypothetical protein
MYNEKAERFDQHHKAWKHVRKYGSK